MRWINNNSELKRNVHGRDGETVTKHEHCCMKYANRKPNYQMARSISIQRHYKLRFGLTREKKTETNQNCLKSTSMFKRQNRIIKTNWTFRLMLWMNIGRGWERENKKHVRPCWVHSNGFYRAESNPIWETDAQFGLQENFSLLNSKSCQGLYFIGEMRTNEKEEEKNGISQSLIQGRSIMYSAERKREMER